MKALIFNNKTVKMVYFIIVNKELFIIANYEINRKWLKTDH